MTNEKYEFNEVYGTDKYRITVPVNNGAPAVIECNGAVLKWKDVPPTIKGWIFRVFDGNGRDMEQYPFPQPPIVQEGKAHGQS
jgi:hypothetical protein